LSTGGHVGGAEIGDGGYAGAGGDDGRLANFAWWKKWARPRKETGSPWWKMVWAVGGDQVEGFEGGR